MKKIIFYFLVLISLISCIDNNRVKKYGGTATLELSPNEKLVNVTWKDKELWILTTEMTEKDSAKTYTFKEKSSLGLVEGKYIIVEIKK